MNLPVLEQTVTPLSKYIAFFCTNFHSCRILRKETLHSCSLISTFRRKNSLGRFRMITYFRSKCLNGISCSPISAFRRKNSLGHFWMILYFRSKCLNGIGAQNNKWKELVQHQCYFTSSPMELSRDHLSCPSSTPLWHISIVPCSWTHVGLYFICLSVKSRSRIQQMCFEKITSTFHRILEANANTFSSGKNELAWWKLW